MHWNHRVMRREAGEDLSYDIHEVYYDGGGNVTGWTQNAVSPCADSRDEILLALARMAEAIGQPVLNFADGKEVEPKKVMTDDLTSALKNVMDVFDASAPAAGGERG